MSSVRIQRQIERLLDEAEAAVVEQNWQLVRERVAHVLKLDPDNVDAQAFAAAADRGLSGESKSPPEVRPTSSNSVVPTSFSGGRYVVKKFLGEGGKKKVYLAHDTKLDRDIAFALIKTEGLDAAGRTRITHEAMSMGRLGGHPHIVTVLDIGDEGDQPYLVAELMGGGDVEGLIEQAESHRLPLDRTLRIADEVCRALEHAHANNIVHRDLKPGNVWLTNDGTVKLGDFGLAIALDRSRMTLAGTMVGTVAYMPPEQAMGGNPDSRADLYSLGAMLYEMMTGRPPFIGDDTVSVIGQHLNTPPIAPTWHNPQCSAAMESLILQLLAKSPNDRPASATAVRERLRLIAEAPVEIRTDAPAVAQGGVGRLAWGRFVGRTDELGTLKTALDAALGGQGSLVMLVGEPGIGKTRLAEEVLVYAQLRGAQTLWGRCYEAESAFPYMPFVEALRQYVATRPDEALRAELGNGVSDVAKLVSEVRQRVPASALATEIPPEQERQRLYESVVNFLINAAAANPIVLVLDDLHWADAPTLNLLKNLARSIKGNRLLVIGTYRDMDLDRRHPLAEVLADLRRERLFERILLRGMSPLEVGALLEMAAQQDLDQEGTALAAALHRATEGNPFFIEETVRHLVETGRIFRREGRWVSDTTNINEMGIPEGVREVIGRRLSRLSSACNGALASAAVLGREFEFAVLGAMTGLDEDALLTVIEEAIEAQAIVEVKGKAVAAYIFSHALVRQTLYEELSLPRKQRLHARAADAIEKVHVRNLPTHVASLATHYRLAGAAGNPEKAISYSLRAGDAAQVAFAHEDAANHLEGALEVMEDQGVEPIRRADLLRRLGDLMFISGADLQKGIIYGERALALYEEAGDVEGAAQMHSRLGRDLSSYPPTMNIDRALVHFRAAEAVLAKGPERASLVELHTGIAFAAIWGLRLDEGLTSARRAMEIAERLNDERLWCRAASIYGRHLWASGRIKEGTDLMERAWEKADRLNLDVAAFFATLVGASPGLAHKDPDDTIRWVERELSKPRVAQAPGQRNILVSFRSMALIGLGKSEVPVHNQSETESLWGLGMEQALRLSRGEWEQGTDSAIRNNDAQRIAGNRWWMSLVSASHGNFLRLLGRPEAGDALVRAISLCEMQHLPAELVHRALLAQIYGETGRPAEAMPQLARCHEILANGEDWRAIAGRVALADGVVAANGGSPTQDFDVHFAQAVDLFQRFHTVWDEAEALHQWGRALVSAGEKARAIANFDSSLEIYRRIGAGERWMNRVLTDKIVAQGILNA
jgi:tetratricopeptide (TPR) repeat protein